MPGDGRHGNGHQGGNAVAETTPIAVLGGSFDPVHNGHLAFAQLAAEYFRPGMVIFIPANVPPHKSNTVYAPAKHRLAMLRKAVAANPLFSTWDIELRRSGKSYTVDTLQILRRRHPGREILFLIGSDNLNEIRTWRHYKTVLSMVTLCVAHRPGYSMKVPSQIRGARIRACPSPEWALSSTHIRGLLRHRHSCRYLLAPAVLDYIDKCALYRQP